MKRFVIASMLVFGLVSQMAWAAKVDIVVLSENKSTGTGTNIGFFSTNVDGVNGPFRVIHGPDERNMFQNQYYVHTYMQFSSDHFSKPYQVNMPLDLGANPVWVLKVGEISFGVPTVTGTSHYFRILVVTDTSGAKTADAVALTKEITKCMIAIKTGWHPH